jgi:fatty-acyl-CoA synthase
MESVRLIEKTPSAYSYPLLIKQLLHTPILYAPDQEIVYRDIMRYTYRGFYRRINRLASALSTIGVKPGDVVAMLDWDSHRYLECFFAVPMMGAILHTVNIRLSSEQILYTMAHGEDTVVLVHEDFLPILEEQRSRLKNVRAYVLLKDRDEEPPRDLPIVDEYENMIAHADEDFDFPEFPEDTLATLFYTTGTTGAPKGVYYSHRQLTVHTLACAVAMGSYTAQGRFQSADVYMPVTPMFHVHAWGFPYVATMIGAKQVYPGQYEPEMILSLIEAEGVTFSHCVPTILHMILSSPRAREVDLSGWKLMIGGASFPRGLAKSAWDLGIDVYAAYGMSETCPVLTVANLKPHMLEWEIERQLDFRMKTGFPIPLVDLKVVDDSGTPLPRDGRTPGEILVRAPWLTQGYFKETERSEELWRGGWLHTGDIAHMDQEGYVRITDRLKDVIKSGGEWISSLELESHISRHEAVREAAVVGLHNEKWGERPVALVVLDPDYLADDFEVELKDFLSKLVDDGTISKWAIPDRVFVVTEIPKTSVGKINKREIRSKLS